MRAHLKTTGGPELLRNLRALEHAVARPIQVEALTAGAEPIRAAAAALAKRSARGGPHLADDIVIGVPSLAQLERREHFDETVVEVGPSKRPTDHFYGYFQEYGTRRHPAHPFLRPAFDTHHQESLAIAFRHLWAAIERTVGRPT